MNEYYGYLSGGICLLVIGGVVVGTIALCKKSKNKKAIRYQDLKPINSKFQGKLKQKIEEFKFRRTLNKEKIHIDEEFQGFIVYKI